MSTTVDQRVVEMRFDNKQFESGVSTTMSTLDKLKQKLHLDGATKGLEDVNSAAKNVNMSGLGSSVETVSAKFSALQVMGVTALANITNSAVNAGKRIVSALTIDPIKAGFQEYETQINAVQTILANTESKGSTIDDVNKALDELNKYADMTIYNFTEMTRNIGTFTAAGVDLDTSTNAIKGIANLAAVSGSTSQQASTAMYQLSQALASGTVKLMDWNSVVNAGMGGQVFQDALKETARVHGVAIDEMIESQGSFRETLSEGWLTSEILTDTLQKFTLTTEGLTEAEIEANREMLRAKGYTEEQIEGIFKLGNTATNAATKVKTFTQLWDVLKESAQSGWSQTWKLIVGDFEEAKELLTPLADMLTGFINKMSDARNRVLQIALDFMSPWTSIMDKLSKVTDVTDKIGDVTDTLEYFQDVVNRVWRGDFNNWFDTPDRRDLLAAAGYDQRVVQDLVNLGYGYEITIDDIRASHEKFGLTLETTSEETEKVTDALNGLSDEVLINAGLTEDEIRLYRALEKEADRLGISVSDLADEMSNNNGRDMLIDSFKNIGQAFIDLAGTAKTAFAEIFNPPSTEEVGVRLYGIIRSLKEFTEKLSLVNKETGELNETGQQFKRIFKGVFAVVHAVATILGGPLKIAFKILSQLLKVVFDLPILEIVASIGDAAVAFDTWLSSVLDFTAVFEKLAPTIRSAYDTVSAWVKSRFGTAFENISKVVGGVADDFREWIDSLKEAENLPEVIAHGIVKGFKKIPEIFAKIIDGIKSAFTGGAKINFGDMFKVDPDSFLGKIANGFKVAGQTIVELGKILLGKVNEFLSARGFKEISTDSIAGLVEGLKEGASKAWNAAVEMVTNLVQKVKAFLGIHSPSTVFAAIGGFIIAGLIAGLRNGIPDSLGAIKDVFQPMLDWIKGIDLGAVFAGVIGIFAARTGYKAVGALERLAAPLEGLQDIFSGVGEVLGSTAKVMRKSVKPIKKILNNTAKVVKSFSGVLKGISFNMKMKGIQTLVTSILMLVGAIVVLTFLDPKELWNAVGIVFALSAILVGLAFAMDKLSSATATVDFKKGIDIQGLSSGLAGIGIAILLLAVSVKMLGSLSPEQAKQGFLGLAGLVVAIAGVIAAFGFLVKGKAAENIDKFGMSMTKLAVALLLMAVVAKMLGKMDQGVLIQGGIAIIAFAGIMVGLMAATKLISGSKNVETVGKTLLKIALAIGVMAIVAKMLGKMDLETLIQGGIAIVAFGGIIVGLMAATKLITGSKNIDKIGPTLLKIALAIGIMGIVAKLVGGMDPAELFQGVLAITAFGGIIVGLMAATKLITGSKNIEKIGGAILAVSGAIAIMAFTAFLLSMVSWEGFAKGTIMVTAFAGIIVGLIAATKLVGNNADKIGKNIITVAAAIGILGLVAVLLSLVPVENMKRGLIIVSVLSLLMMGLIAVTGLSKDCMKTVIAIAGTIAILGGVLYLLSTMPVESTIGSAIALGGLMLILTGVLFALSHISKKIGEAVVGVLLLTAMAVPLLAFVGVLALMQNVQNATTNAMALTVLAAAMTLLLIPLTLVGTFAASALMGVLALTAMAVPLLAFVGILALMSGIQNGIANAMALTTLMTAIGDVLFKISLVAPLAVVGVAALNAMIGLMTTMGILATAIGALVTQFPQLQTFLDTGIDILAQLASGLGRVIGSFITGFAGEVMTILPMLGLCLSQFMINVQAFVIGAKLIDEKVLVGIGILSAAILALTAADLITGLFSLGGLGLIGLGAQLSGFMLAAKPFITTAATITPEMMAGVKALAETLLILTAADLLDGLKLFGGSSLETFATQLPILGQGLSAFSTSLGTFTEEQLATVNCAAQAIKTLAQASSEIPNTGGLLGQLVGENDLGTFAAQFPILGTGLAQFLSNVGTFSDEQVATVNCAAQAIKALAQASSEIPNSGGLLAQIVGDNDLGTFSAQFPILGTGLRGFLDNVGTFTDEQVATVNCAAQAIKTLAAAASEIPNEGGWISKIVGDNSLGTFAEQFPKLGTGLAGFLTNVGTFTDEQVATVNCGANAVKTLAAAASTLPDEGGWISKIVGDNSLGTFADHFPKLGTGLAGFVSELGTFTDAQVTSVNAAVRAIQALAALANADLKGATNHLSDFGKDLPDFAADLASFCSDMPSSESTTAAVNNLNKILDAVKSIAKANSEPLATFADNLKKVGKNAVDKFIEAFTSSSAKTDLKDAAKKLGDQVVDGIEAKEKAIKSAGENAAKKAVDGAETQDDEMESAGKDLGAGLVKGINAKKQAAYDAGYALGQKAVQGEKDGQKSNSPSKATIQAGHWFGDGLVLGIKQMFGQVYNTGHDLGETATNSISGAISRVADMVSSDIDAQPTIRPVMDLSDVETGVGAIGHMLDMNGSVGVMANVGSINSMMNRRIQNGSNSDVVSAIDKLRKELGNVGNTTYQVNGVTYDDGSNISTAVREIARAAIRERRV